MYSKRYRTAGTQSPRGGQCQNCYQRGHWTFQCKNPKVYLQRPSASEILKNPKLRPKIDDLGDIPEGPRVTDGDYYRDSYLRRKREFERAMERIDQNPSLSKREQRIRKKKLVKDYMAEEGNSTEKNEKGVSKRRSKRRRSRSSSTASDSDESSSVTARSRSRSSSSTDSGSSESSSGSSATTSSRSSSESSDSSGKRQNKSSGSSSSE